MLPILQRPGYCQTSPPSAANSMAPNGLHDPRMTFGFVEPTDALGQCLVLTIALAVDSRAGAITCLSKPSGHCEVGIVAACVHIRSEFLAFWIGNHALSLLIPTTLADRNLAPKSSD